MNEREAEKVARELALQSKHKNEGLWELTLGDAYHILIYEPERAKALMQAYDDRKRKGATK